MRIYKCYKNQENRRGPELNGKIGNIKYDQRVYDDSTYENKPLEFLKHIWDTLDIGSVYLLKLFCGSQYIALVQTYNRLSYGSAVIISYALSHSIYVRRVNDVWITSDFALTSDLEQIICTVETKSNDKVPIPGAPSTPNYVPITVAHSNKLECIENIMFNGQAWYIYSDSSQTVSIRFFKYPV